MRKIFLILSLAFIFIISSCGGSSDIAKDASGNEVKIEAAYQGDFSTRIDFALGSDGYIYYPDYDNDSNLLSINKSSTKYTYYKEEHCIVIEKDGPIHARFYYVYNNGENLITYSSNHYVTYKKVPVNG